MQNNRKQITLAVDIGGTKTAIAGFDGQANELFYACIPTQPESGAGMLCERVYGLFCANKGDYVAVRGVIAAPGPMDADKGMLVDLVTMGWKNVPIVQLFEKKFGICFTLLNDCDAGALGVYAASEFCSAKMLAYFSISTGIGGGIVSCGRLITGNGNAANFGHIPVGGEGLECGCGRRDCLELYASGSGIERRYLHKTQSRISCAQIAERARAGDKIAAALFREAGEKLSYALDCVCAVLDCDVVVFGGSVLKSAGLFMPYALTKARTCKFGFAPEHGKQVLYGAYRFIK